MHQLFTTVLFTTLITTPALLATPSWAESGKLEVNTTDAIGLYVRKRGNLATSSLVFD